VLWQITIDEKDFALLKEDRVTLIRVSASMFHMDIYRLRLGKCQREALSRI
jgi:hypothetical protein